MTLNWNWLLQSFIVIVFYFHCSFALFWSIFLLDWTPRGWYSRKKWWEIPSNVKESIRLPDLTGAELTELLLVWVSFQNEWIPQSNYTYILLSCQKSDPCVCAQISGIATGQTLRRAGKECMAKACFDVQKKRVCRESIAFSPQFYHKWIKITLVLGKCKFLSELPRNML